MYKGYTKTELKQLKASEILAGAVEDIQSGKWICYELQQIKCDEPNHKEMGCAVGLVSLNSGDTQKVKVEAELYGDSFENYYGEEDLETTDIDIEKQRSDYVTANCQLVGVSKEILDSYIEVAVYTGSKSPTGAKRAIECLYEAIPSSFLAEYEERNSYSFAPKKTSLHWKRDAVVNYNDDGNLTPKKAEKWFQKAQQIAVKKGW